MSVIINKLCTGNQKQFEAPIVVEEVRKWSTGLLDVVCQCALTVQRSMICVSLMASVEEMCGPTTGRSAIRGLACGTWYSFEGML